MPGCAAPGKERVCSRYWVYTGALTGATTFHHKPNRVREMAVAAIDQQLFGQKLGFRPQHPCPDLRAQQTEESSMSDLIQGLVLA